MIGGGGCSAKASDAQPMTVSWSAQTSTVEYTPKVQFRLSRGESKTMVKLHKILTLYVKMKTDESNIWPIMTVNMEYTALKCVNETGSKIVTICPPFTLLHSLDIESRSK